MIRALPVLAALAAACGGCISREQYERLDDELHAARRQVAELTAERDRLAREKAELEKRVEGLLALGEKRLERLFYVKSIRLGRYTGGWDRDGQAGDEGVKVYLEPIDQHGSVVKAAGDVRVQLFDLAAPAKGNLIGEWRWGVEKIAGQWHSGLGAYHYSFECPWPDGPPAHDELTVRVEFTDYLTGRTHTAQKLCRATLPAK